METAARTIFWSLLIALGQDLNMNRRWQTAQGNSLSVHDRPVLRVAPDTVPHVRVHLTVKRIKTKDHRDYDDFLNTSLTPWSITRSAPALPLLGHGRHERAALAGGVNHLDVIGRELQQIPQGPRLHSQGVGDEIVLQVHGVHSFCERHLGTHKPPKGLQPRWKNKEKSHRAFSALFFKTSSSASLRDLVQHQVINPSGVNLS